MSQIKLIPLVLFRRFNLQLWNDHQSAFSPSLQLEMNNKMLDSSDLPIFLVGQIEGTKFFVG